MNLRLIPIDLVTRHPFGISRGTTSSKPSLIVELEQGGVRGYGEAAEYAFFGALRADTMATLEALRPLIADWQLTDPGQFWTAMRDAISRVTGEADSGRVTFPLSALDTAAHDLWGKLKGRPVWELWGLSTRSIPPSNYTIGIDSIGMMQQKLSEQSGFPVYKIKLGTVRDLEIVRALRDRTSAPFRIDANAGWGELETQRNAELLHALGVELIEQPLARSDWAGMARLHPNAPIPFIADESCGVESDVARCPGHFHGINIKLEKCGGLTPARRMITEARSLGLRVMIGCFTQSTVGISAAAQLLPLVDYADLDGALLLANDVAQGVRIESGRVLFPDTPGCGILWD